MEKNELPPGHLFPQEWRCLSDNEKQEWGGSVRSYVEAVRAAKGDAASVWRKTRHKRLMKQRRELLTSLDLVEKQIEGNK